MKRIPAKEYLEKAKLLAEDETERLLSRMPDELMRAVEEKEIGAVEAVAIQLEIEDQKLMAWRAKAAEMRRKEETEERIYEDSIDELDGKYSDE